MKTIIFVLVGIALIGGIFMIVKPNSPSENLESAPKAASHTFEFKIEEHKVVAKPETMKVTQGEEVTLVVTVGEEDDTLHIHGYDLTLDLKKDVPGKISFLANITGLFEVELHHDKIKLGALEVLPK